MMRLLQGLRAAGVVTLVVAWVLLPASAATFVATTGNASNAVSTAPAPAPPANLVVVVSSSVPPLCDAQLSWEPSPGPGVTGYEIERLDAASGVGTAGPWVVGAGTVSFTDTGLTPQPPTPDHRWRVRALTAAWPSGWVEYAQQPAERCTP